jgi:hypothetical protein
MKLYALHTVYGMDQKERGVLLILAVAIRI